MGVIDILADKGEEGMAAVYKYVKESSIRSNGFRAMQEVHRKVHPISYEEMMDVCAYWVDVALNITEKDLRLMNRFVTAQDRKASGFYDEERISYKRTA